jgi:predicted nucleic-acid-binding protein
MKIHCALDTNCVVSFLIGRGDASRVEKLLSQSVCYVSAIVLTEVEYVLRAHYGYSRSDISDNLKTLSEQPHIDVELKGYLGQILDDYCEYTALSFTDLILAFEAQDKGYSALYTLDKKLAKQKPKLVKLV